MRVVLQRVSQASVSIGGRRVAGIERGFCLLAGFTHTDTVEQVTWMAEKITGLRIFSDAEGKMNLGLTDVGGGVLVVSQFTLYGDARRGNRPSYVAAARPERAEPLYERFADRLGAARGVFGAMMEVELVNDGPVTLLVELS
jgi:D-tyrosyl-tRNA(Tyr) deacylase